ncbi:MAG: AAA family ATPase, partial [Gammaproteobacteria bacterium]
MSHSLIQNLQNPKLYPHPVQYFKVIETILSWVILTGSYAYKIKKPVNFGFLDFSKLSDRKYYCERELKFNRVLAGDIYLEVIPITGSESHPELNGTGVPIEYALKLVEFPQSMLFDELAKHGKLKLQYMEDISEILANFHLKADRQSPPELGTVEQVHEPVIQNFDQIRPLLHSKDGLIKIDQLQTWAQSQWEKWHDVLINRKNEGFIRACHGDIHLGNIALINDIPVIFDCIEFNEPFRWTDTMADIAFLLMDLRDQKQFEFENLLLNNYLEITGDYEGLNILPYYCAYRAMVRAKVNLFQYQDKNLDEAKKTETWNRFQKYIALAENYMKQSEPFLIITHGLAATGKTTAAKKVALQTGAIQIRSDIERKRLAGLERHAKTQSGLYADLYHPDMTEKTYLHLRDLAKHILQAGYSVIVDATFLSKAHRDLFINLTHKMKIPFYILECTANQKHSELLKQRQANE